MGKYNQCPELDSVVRTITVTLSWEPLLSIVMEAIIVTVVVVASR